MYAIHMYPGVGLVVVTLILPVMHSFIHVVCFLRAEPGYCLYMGRGHREYAVFTEHVQ